MKQNERLLVYAVTGFLALILVIAVLFGNDPANAAGKKDNPALGLNEMLNGKSDTDEAAKNAAEEAKKSAEKKAETPLIAKPVLAADLVAKELGTSRRDRFVRFVPVKRGDSFEKLVRRWCGSTDGYLKEALCLNEEVTVLQPGTEVAVPWVDNEVLAAIIEAQAPRTLVAQGAPNGGRVAEPAGTPTANTSAVPSFLTPGSSAAGNTAGTPTAGGPTSGAPVGGIPVGGAPAATVKEYKVKAGDSLWKIAAKRYGKRNADRMVKAIKELNPGMSETLQIDQLLKVPAE